MSISSRGRRKSSVPSSRPRETNADDRAPLKTTAKLGAAQDSAGSYLRCSAVGTHVETALFISVQVVMLACVVLVAARLIAAV